MKAYYRRLTSRSRKVRLAAARAWSVWEATTSKLRADPKAIARFGRGPRSRDAFARIECHYFVNGGFLAPDDQLLRGVAGSATSPPSSSRAATTWSARCDSAWALHRAWPEAKLIVVPDAGHSMTEPGIRSALIAETDRMARL